jgi:hypothetical protein
LKTQNLAKYAFASITLLTLFASTWYAKTTWISHAASSANDRLNVAAAVNGGLAVPSSSINDDTFPASSIIDGDRKGVNWGAGGGWADGTPGEFPDTMDVEFSDAMSIDEVDVFTTQDTWWNPIEPVEALSFLNYGITAFEVQYFDGDNWLTVPGGTVTDNTMIWRKFTFAPVMAEKIRVKINAAKSPYSALVELEAYGVPAVAPSPSPTPTPTPTPSGDLASVLAERDIYIDANNNVGFGTQNPIFNDDGTTGAFVGKWVAIDGKLPDAAAYLGIGGTILELLQPGDGRRRQSHRSHLLFQWFEVRNWNARVFYVAKFHWTSTPDADRADGRNRNKSCRRNGNDVAGYGKDSRCIDTRARCTQRLRSTIVDGAKRRSD